jgi:hypothetical protein
MMTMVDLKAIADGLRTISRKNQTANGAALLQAVAAWLEGTDIFSPPAELWEHADRLCGGNPNVAVKTCPICGGRIVCINDLYGLCGCPNIVATSHADVKLSPADTAFMYAADNVHPVGTPTAYAVVVSECRPATNAELGYEITASLPTKDRD